MVLFLQWLWECAWVILASPPCSVWTWPSRSYFSPTSERQTHFPCFPQLEEGQPLEALKLFHCFCSWPSPSHRDMAGASSFFPPSVLWATSSPPRCYLYNKLAAKGFLGNAHAFLLSVLQAGLNCPAIAQRQQFNTAGGTILLFWVHASSTRGNFVLITELSFIRNCK